MTSPFPSGSPGVPESNMPTGAPGLVPRRSSYASVVSGSVSALNHQQPVRSGAFSHLLNQTSEFSYDTHVHQHGGSYRHESRGLDFDMQRASSGCGLRITFGRSGQLPSFSSAFGSLTNGHENGGGNVEPFFVPSYLKGSRYIRKLEEAYKTRVTTRREAPSSHSSHPGSLSTSSSSANLHAKMSLSHRGMQFDLIEKAPPLEDDGVSPLPSKWNNNDKSGGLEILGDGQEVKFTGRVSSDRDHEASSIRTDHSISPQSGIYYFEVTILSRKREETSVCIGFSGKDVSLTRPPGLDPESWGYHGDDGHAYSCQSSGKTYGPSYGANDVIGCGINFRTGCAFFTKNGNNLGTVFRDIRGKLFPSVGMKKLGEHIRVNFGHTPFSFDIDGMMSQEKRLVMQQVSISSTSKLAPPLDETSLIQSLILQFLSHDGYVETAKAFAEEVHAERRALNIDPQATIDAFDFVKEDRDAINRQRIRTAILDGDVDKALKLTDKFYPNVLKENEHIYFRLRSRKFIEMIREASEIRNSNLGSPKKSNGHSGGDWYEDVINHDMELDDVSTNNSWDKMDTEGSNNSEANYYKLLGETITYGRILQAEFKDDPKQEVHKSLENAYALLAYEDPLNSKEVSHLLKREGRVAVAEELNSAILVSLGKSSCAALERLIQQTTALLDDLRETGGPAAFINVDDYINPLGTNTFSP